MDSHVTHKIGHCAQVLVRQNQRRQATLCALVDHTDKVSCYIRTGKSHHLRPCTV